MKLAGLASNRGRNLMHLADRAPGGAELATVLTDEADAPVLESAAERGVPTETVVPAADAGRRAHDRSVVDALADYDVDLVCLDGYMRILSDAFLDAMPTTINVHPSLLPAFPGADAWGDALEAGVRVTGCTVHVVVDAVAPDGSVVDDRVDAGPILTQEAVAVYADDDRATLKDRVLYDAEFQAYPRAVDWFATGRVTVDYDAETLTVDGDAGGQFPARRLHSGDREATLRYGENPHQSAAVYADYTGTDASVVTAPQLNPGAKGLSYNNYNDADAALELVTEFDDPAAAVIKHTNPAGCATAADLETAYERALATDPQSAFGGIVALNRRCDEATADRITESFKEVVVAPGYTDGAWSTLAASDDLRVLAVGDLDEGRESVTEKQLVGGTLVQERDRQDPDLADCEVPTARAPTSEELATMQFAWRTVKHVKSNAIVFATGSETVGVGMGQVSRVDAVRLAAMKAADHAEEKTAEGAVMASDAFFPFPDGIEHAAEAGIAAVVQPGGSRRDDQVVAAADEHDMAMVFTGSRCFRHD